MNASCSYVPYRQTGAFSRIALDYLAEEDILQPFYQHPVSLDGIRAAIAARQAYSTNRSVLVQALQKQYEGYELTNYQKDNLNSLNSEATFTVTTAHQPNIFTGPLYFIYKILHAIKLAAYLQKQLPQYRFVPVYYMGSEDADLDELGHINMGGEKIEWQTNQTGAVGRMSTKGLEKITDRLQKEFGHMSFGNEMVQLCRQAYGQHANVQEATLYLVNELFKDYGLLVLVPDNASLKKLFEPVIWKELTEQFSSKLVAETTGKLALHYKVQAGGREINLFYLDDGGARERIERAKDKTGQWQYYVAALEMTFTEAAILEELQKHPERFSANVILRGVFQEMILPDIAFIGGGGELAYWLELKNVFETLQVPYPVLILRNSFLILEQRALQLLQKLKMDTATLFLPVDKQLQLLIASTTTHQLELETEKQTISSLFSVIQKSAFNIDPTLQAYVAAQHARTLQNLHKLETKMRKAEKRHHADKERQLNTLRKLTNPGNNLQERVDNFMPLYARYGKDILKALFQNSFTMEAGFGIVRVEEL